ncbi:MAG TPA: 3-oxoacyl-[acyl-carrier-protein] synthase III C-terminal domain-containing protein [Steroidobacteraceae bacterium]|nr:3-oxoacyl-[acyl-carrier-protein] synthase III C-terminal domain-containing protein [Steroidobacteraceae bacterium]
MFVAAIGIAVPDHRYTKSDCWDAFAESPWFDRLSPRSRMMTRAVLQRDNGIEARFLAVDSLDEVFAIDPDTLQRRFSIHAPKLADAAGTQALRRAGVEAHQIDAVIVSTCTGYLCPGLSGYVSERLGLRRDVRGYDLVGQGCAGALPNWQLASALLDSGQCEHVLSICVEVCSAAMYLDDDPGVLISACLFGDGAGAAVLSRRPPAAGRSVQWRHTASMTDPAAREALRFEHRAGLLRNILTPAVPTLAAGYAREVYLTALEAAGLKPADVGTWIFHAGGRDVLLAIQKEFALSPETLGYSREVLRQYGNLSSAFVYFVLDAALTDNAPAGWWWMSSFGAGFSCHGALLSVS